MKVIIDDQYLENLFEGTPVKGKPKYNEEIIRGFRKKVLLMKNASGSKDLRNIKSLHFEKLSGNLNGKFSVRINNAFRIIFRIETENNSEILEIVLIENLSNHYS